MSEQYQRYLPGYREGVEMDMDTVVGKGWVQWYEAPKNDKGEPIDSQNHGPDAARYLCWKWRLS